MPKARARGTPSHGEQPVREACPGAKQQPVAVVEQSHQDHERPRPVFLDQATRTVTLVQFALHQQSAGLDPAVVAALIAVPVGMITIIVQLLGIHRVSKDTNRQLDQQRQQLDVTLAEQREQLDRTFAEQREQLDRTLGEQRERTLNERFATAADRLGNDKSPAVRLAGVYAMAGLADDWPENRQTCVDVLCAYLRMPYSPQPHSYADEADLLAFHASREVRHTVIRVIGTHLQPDAPVPWSELNFDFTGVQFDGGDFSNAQFLGGNVSFVHASFVTGNILFTDARFSGGKVAFLEAGFGGARVYFTGARFSKTEVSFSRSGFDGSTLDFRGAEFDGARVWFDNSGFASGTLDFSEAKFDGARVWFDSSGFVGGTLDFSRSALIKTAVSFGKCGFEAGEVNFDEVAFSECLVHFKGSGFVGADVHFNNVTLTGGDIDLTEADEWLRPPSFNFPGTPPPEVRLP